MLALLVAASPDGVSKDRFADTIWPSGEMSDESLARCISQLRRLIPLDAGVMIRSVYGFGYQLVPLQSAISTPLVHRRLAEIAGVPPALAEGLLHARTLLDSNDRKALERARQILQGLVLQAPRYLQARITLAELLARLAEDGKAGHVAQLAEAEHELLVVESLAPATLGLDSAMGRILDLSWRFDEAAERHRRAIRTQPDDAASHSFYGIHLHSTGRPVDAVEAFRRAAALRPHSLALTTQLARQYYTLGDHHSALATVDAMRGDAERDRAARSFVHSLTTYISGTGSEQAQAAHEEAAAHHPLAAPNLGYLFARNGDREKAQRVVDNEAANEPARSLGFVPTLLELGHIDEAMSRVEEAAANHIPFLPGILRRPEFARLGMHRRFVPLRNRLERSAEWRPQPGQNLPSKA